MRREQVGRFRVDDAVALEKVSQTTVLVSPLDLVGDMPRVELTAAEVAAVRQGRVVGAVPPMAEQTTALVQGRELVAIGTPRGGRWQPVTVLGPE